jgi:hypothetical protein
MPPTSRKSKGKSRSQSPAKPAVAKPTAAAAPMVIVAVLAFWFASCAVFNDLTPRLMKKLRAVEEGQGAGFSDMDVTVIELALTVAIAGAKLLAEGQRAVVPPALASKLVAIGALHLGGCRLFIYAQSLGLPVSLAQVPPRPPPGRPGAPPLRLAGPSSTPRCADDPRDEPPLHRRSRLRHGHTLPGRRRSPPPSRPPSPWRAILASRGAAAAGLTVGAARR